MITRTITIDGHPNIQITLYFESRSNAEKVPTKVSDNIYTFEDDFKQRVILDSSKIVSDLITDVTSMFEAQRKMEVTKLHAAKKTQEAIDNDPLLKVWLEIQRRNHANSQRQQMPMPGIMIPQ